MTQDPLSSCFQGTYCFAPVGLEIDARGAKALQELVTI